MRLNILPPLSTFTITLNRRLDLVSWGYYLYVFAKHLFILSACCLELELI